MVTNLVNIEKLTHFQTWVLFMTFKKDDEWVSPRYLLKTCCESSFMELNPDNIDKELNELANLKYLERNAAFMTGNVSAGILQVNDKLKYRISNNGICYVRQLHIHIRDADLSNSADEILLETQHYYKELRMGIKNRTLGREALISVGLKDIGGILQLLGFILGTS